MAYPAEPHYKLRQAGGNMIAIVLGLLATVGIGMLALVSYLFYLTPDPRDRLE